MKLPQEFYLSDTKKVAQALLLKRLVHIKNGKRLSGLIVETEAYLGIKDRAAHTFGGRRTKRNESMYLEGGHAYVYMIYGLHFCINVVTQTAGTPEAVLIRALQPDEGIEEMRLNRKTKIDKLLTSGPGKLCQALSINKSQDGLSFSSDELFIEETGLKLPKKQIIVRPRIGVDYAGAHARLPLRFYVAQNPYVSAR